MSNKGTIDDVYFEWLYGQIGAVVNRNPARSHWNLARQLYTKAFISYVRNDQNRSEDGKGLRGEFLDQCDIPADEEWLDLPCSMLEMLIALSRRTAFNSEGEPLGWFWKFMENLDLRKYTDDRHTYSVIDTVDLVLERVINRTYNRDGVGGLFPLQHAHQDQRKVELWYQMSTYLLEGEHVDT